MLHIDNHYYLHRPKTYYIYVVFIFLLILIMIMCRYHYTIYFNTTGVVTTIDNQYYVQLYVDVNQLDKVISGNALYVNNKKYPYQVIKISNDILVDNYVNYKEVLMLCPLDSKYMINNNVINLNIKYKKVLLMKYILNFITGKED